MLARIIGEADYKRAEFVEWFCPRLGCSSRFAHHSTLPHKVCSFLAKER